MRFSTFTVGAVCAGGLALAAYSTRGEEPTEDCAGEIRLHGPIWDLSAGTLEAGLDVVLDEVARTILTDCGGEPVLIEAHAYELPDPELNLKLSELRAEIVRHELEKRGVPATQLRPAPFGDTQPLFPVDGSDAWARNRRITFRAAD